MHPLGIPAEVYRVGDAMDLLARLAEEWGTIQMSAPLLVEPGTNFGFNLQRGTSNYFTEAKSEIQGGVAFSDQISQSLNVALQVQNDPTAAAAFAESMRRYQADMNNIEDTQSMLQRLNRIQFTDGLNSALAQVRQFTR